jgi:NAD(P)-dependent dehydrogenase (short-subunit alcohol dehydrogenase family)
MSNDDILNLGGQVAFVTGAGQGAGREIALTLARHNAGGVGVNDFVPERAAAVVAEIEALGVRAVAAPADVGDLNAVKAAVAKTSEALGPVTILVNNAGNAGPNMKIDRAPPLWETDPSQWDHFFRTNLIGVLNSCHAAIPGMIAAKRGGRIVTIVSDAGRAGEPGLVAYSAAKAGAAGAVRAIARETGRYGITSNAVALSALEPPFEPQALADFIASDHAKATLSRYIIRRYGKPSDVAAMALFLCSNAASWITGQTYPVNGGYQVNQ